MSSELERIEGLPRRPIYGTEYVSLDDVRGVFARQPETLETQDVKPARVNRRAAGKPADEAGNG